ncbi:MAG: hypothetical protein KAH10_03900 [Flavobacteriales bacterium]|nr:hypothetical protein [Flavobacteriales bacterium]
MWAIIDSRAPKEAINNLSRCFDVFEFSSDNITYKEVSGHPDIFIFQDEEKLIVAPNSPIELTSFLDQQNASYTLGKKEIGKELSNSTQYNCIATEKFLLHKKGYTDEVILVNTKSKKLVELPQAYTRCSLTMINENNYITSDRGIERSLSREGHNILNVSAKQILLPGYPYGFFGGTNGIFNNTFYLIGSLKHHEQEEVIRKFILRNKLEIVELYDGPLYDGGGIFFGNNQ